jgi:hypothetical protein
MVPVPESDAAPPSVVCGDRSRVERFAGRWSGVGVVWVVRALEDGLDDVGFGVGVVLHGGPVLECQCSFRLGVPGSVEVVVAEPVSEREIGRASCRERVLAMV